MKKIGFTTSIPVEVIFAAGRVPVDLNNVFISSKSPGSYIDEAEKIGFPRNTCAWIKGIFSSICKNQIDTLVGVTEGDCSNTRAMLEVLRLNHVEALEFAYPRNQDYSALKSEINALMKYFDVSDAEVTEQKKKLDIIRKRLVHLDKLTYQENKATGAENHLWQVSSSDFWGDLDEFSKKLEEKITEISNREPHNYKFRFGYIGVPPIITDIYDFLQEQGVGVVYNEVQRQFTMAHGIDDPDIVEVYRKFTYPYGIDGRLADISKQIEERKLDAIIHYTQSFCYRAIDDIVFRRKLNIPILTLEGDRPGALDARTKLRIESFLDMLY